MCGNTMAFAGESTGSTTTPQFEDRVALDVVAFVGSGELDGLRSDPVSKYIEDNLNIDLYLTAVTEADWPTQLSAMLADNDLPDVFLLSDPTKQLPMLLESASVLNLEPYLEEYAPKMMDADEIKAVIQTVLSELGIETPTAKEKGKIMNTKDDKFILGGHEFTSRFILGSGKFSLDLVKACIEKADAQIITLALRRANEGGLANILDYIPDDVTLLPNTSGARNAKEAVRIARLSRELGCGDFVKVEVVHDSKYLLPDNYETIKATEILAKEGFVVMPYMYPDLNAARALADAGAACIMPLGAPIGSNKGLCTKEFIQILIDEMELPIIVDAGIGRPSQACEAMEMGAAAVMANTAIATAGDVPAMAEAFKKAIEAGRSAYLSGLGRTIERGASASSPLTGFLQD